MPPILVIKREYLRPLAAGILLVALLVVIGGLFARGPDRADAPDIDEPHVPVWSEDAGPESDDPAADYFADTRLAREKTRSQTVEILREIVNNPNSTSEARGLAQQKLIDMSEKLSMESEAEQLLMAADFDEILVYLMKDAALVLVKGEDMDERQAAQIASVVSRVTGLSWERISIRTHP